MRLAALLVALLAPLPAAGALAPAGALGPGQARVVLVSCAPGIAVFDGRMAARPGTARMKMRFRLRLREWGTERAREVEAAGLREWVISDPGAERYVYTKRVENLLTPGRYRMAVDFRWLDATGEVIARRRATSRACAQQEPPVGR